ncbi:MAG: DUF6320 domain-containing protein [Oscillospiraceae bacterium]|jgi:hypothetical protein|nr:DUF6320 domain-containing protein [Oscillospiraceae bacterium]
MEECKKCRVKIEEGRNRCPLCFSEVYTLSKAAPSYPDYSAAYEESKRFTIKKLLVFLSIVAGSICLMVNLLTLGGGVFLWSIMVIVGLLFCWGVYKSVHQKHINIAGKIIKVHALIAVLVLTIDLCTGFARWSANYILPFLTIATVLCTTLMAAKNKAHYQEYLGHLLVALIISVCPLLLFVCTLSTLLWPSLAALLYSLLTVVGLYIFSDRAFKLEMKKRLHFKP